VCPVLVSGMTSSLSLSLSLSAKALVILLTLLFKYSICD
jgi:hypothetical protein